MQLDVKMKRQLLLVLQIMMYSKANLSSVGCESDFTNPKQERAELTSALDI